MALQAVRMPAHAWPLLTFDFTLRVSRNPVTDLPAAVEGA